MAAPKASLQLCFFGLLLLLIIIFNGSGQNLFPGEEQKAGKNWLLPVTCVQTSFSLAEGFFPATSKQPAERYCPAFSVLSYRTKNA